MPEVTEKTESSLELDASSHDDVHVLDEEQIRFQEKLREDIEKDEKFYDEPEEVEEMELEVEKGNPEIDEVNPK